MKNEKYVILCVDDDQDFLESLRLILEGAGYAFACAGSAEEGLRQYAEVDPDLVIVDLMMEEVDAGVSFVKEMKLRGANKPIYMLSSVGDNLNLSTDYSSLGLAGLFQKPIRPNNLLTTIEARLKKA